MLSLDARARLYVFPHPRITCGIHYVRYVVEFAGGSRVCASPWVFAIIQGDGKSTSTVDELHGGPSKSFLADRCARLLRIRLKGPDEPSNSGNFRGGESDLRTWQWTGAAATRTKRRTVRLKRGREFAVRLDNGGLRCIANSCCTESRRHEIGEHPLHRQRRVTLACVRVCVSCSGREQERAEGSDNLKRAGKTIDESRISEVRTARGRLGYRSLARPARLARPERHDSRTRVLGKDEPARLLGAGWKGKQINVH